MSFCSCTCGENCVRACVECVSTHQKQPAHKEYTVQHKIRTFPFAYNLPFCKSIQKTPVRQQEESKYNRRVCICVSVWVNVKILTPCSYDTHLWRYYFHHHSPLQEHFGTRHFKKNKRISAIYNTPHLICCYCEPGCAETKKRECITRRIDVCSHSQRK